jgi:hypothetical protein
VRALTWASAVVALVAVFGAGTSFIFESAYRSKASLVQIGSVGPDGVLVKRGEPFLAFAPAVAELPGRGDKNARLIREEAKDKVLPIDPILAVLSLGRLAALALLVTSTLVLVLARRAARGGIFSSTTPEAE